MVSIRCLRVVWLASFVVSLAACLPNSQAVAQSAKEKQQELLRTFRDEFVHLTPGKDKFPATFQMGRAAGGQENERPVREVKMNQPFAMARYEVPQNLWEAVMGSNPSKWKGPRNSVEMLSLDEAKTFCERATNLMREEKLIAANEVIRLPSEAEWEYAARAGSTTIYSFGDDINQLNDYAWHTGNAAGNDPPVGAKRPNAWGLYDMHGYLSEWTLDSWHANYDQAPADSAAWLDPAATMGVLRSGSWKDRGDRLTSTSRHSAAVGLRDDAVGLRCVLAKDK